MPKEDEKTLTPEEMEQQEDHAIQAQLDAKWAEKDDERVEPKAEVSQLKGEESVEAVSLDDPPADPPADPPSPQPFVGDYTQEKVIELLQRLEGFDPNALALGIERRVSGHLGPYGERLKKLEGIRDLELDVEALGKAEELKAIDDDLPAALAKILPTVVRAKRTDPNEAFGSLLDERFSGYGEERKAETERMRAEMSDMFEARLLKRFVPDAFEIAKSKEWNSYVMGLKEDEQQALLAWDAQDEQGVPIPGLKNADPLISIFSNFKVKQEEARKKAEENKRTIAANTRKAAQSSTPTPAPRRSTEDIEQAEIDKQLGLTR